MTYQTLPSFQELSPTDGIPTPEQTALLMQLGQDHTWQSLTAVLAELPRLLNGWTQTAPTATASRTAWLDLRGALFAPGFTPSPQAGPLLELGCTRHDSVLERSLDLHIRLRPAWDHEVTDRNSVTLAQLHTFELTGQHSLSLNATAEILRTLIRVSRWSAMDEHHDDLTLALGQACGAAARALVDAPDRQLLVSRFPGSAPRLKQLLTPWTDFDDFTPAFDDESEHRVDVVTLAHACLLIYRRPGQDTAQLIGDGGHLTLTAEQTAEYDNLQGWQRNRLLASRHLQQTIERLSW